MLDGILAFLSQSRGSIISGVEVVPHAQMLRVSLDNGAALELCGGWIYGSGGKVAFGAMDIGFYFGEDPELLELMQEDEQRFLAKLSPLHGLEIRSVTLEGNCLILELSKKKFIKWFQLSKQTLGIRVIRDA